MNTEEFFRERHKPLLRLLVRRLRNADEAEEVLQEAFIQFTKVTASTAVIHPKALLSKIALNIAIDRIRQNATRRAREKAWSDLHYGQTSGTFSAQTPGPDLQIEARMDVERVIVLLEHMSPQVRRAFILHKFEGLSHLETAQTMGLSRSTVEKHIMKALKFLIESM